MKTTMGDDYFSDLLDEDNEEEELTVADSTEEPVVA